LLPASVCFLLVLLFNPEDEGMNSSKTLMAPSDYMALLHRTLHSTQSLLQEPQIQQGRLRILIGKLKEKRPVGRHMNRWGILLKWIMMK
jgi:hypothetical protein